MEPQHEKSAPSKVDSANGARMVQEPSVDTPASQLEMPPWAESYEFSSDVEGFFFSQASSIVEY